MITLAQGVELVLDPTNGKYPENSEWKRDVARHLRICLEILGDIPIEQIKHSHYRAIWRELAKRHAADPSVSGMRAAEMVIGSLRGAMGFLQLEEHIPTGTALPAPRWKTQMVADWMYVTNEPKRRPTKPRATKDEQAALFAALPHADPRLHLAVEIGAELRLGQVVRARRIDIYPYREHEIGGVIIHGRGHKHGADVLFTDQQRAVVTEAMTSGLLSDVEQAFKSNRISNYLLIAGGFLAKGKAQIKNAMRPLGAGALRGYWNDLERLAGVEHQRGRGWYQLRRTAADAAEDVTNDARALNELGGWQDSATRAGYQQQGRLDIKEKARDVRAEIRPKVCA